MPGTLLTGCSQWRLKNELKSFSETEVRIPSDLQVVQSGELQDSIPDISSYPIKLMIYYGREECSSCNINHLHEFDQLFELDVEQQIFSPIIIIAPSEQNYQEAVKLLKCQPHTYPIFIDKDNRFAIQNPNLPDDTRFHTFLIDKNNRVVLVGNPIVSKKMWSLFKSALDNMLDHNGEYVPKIDKKP